MFSTTSAQPISPKLLKGLGCCPTSFCTSGYRRALLARMASSGVGTHRICLLFCKEIPVAPRRISQVYLHLLCLLFSVSHVSKRHFPNGNRRQPPPCLPKSETDGRKSMAAQPFILTIDGVRPFCYKIRLIVSRRITMRAPFQILAIPYRIVDGTPMYCVFHRADHDQWQFIAGGGEDNETPLAAAKRETFEEGGVHSAQWLGLKSLSYIPVTIISEMRRKHWDSSTYVIPEYTFGFECQDDVRLSPEHTDCVWLTYDEANQKLKWDSNRTALYELNCRLKKANEKEA